MNDYYEDKVLTLDIPTDWVKCKASPPERKDSNKFYHSKDAIIAIIPRGDDIYEDGAIARLLNFLTHCSGGELDWPVLDEGLYCHHLMLDVLRLCAADLESKVSAIQIYVSQKNVKDRRSAEVGSNKLFVAKRTGAPPFPDMPKKSFHESKAGDPGVNLVCSALGSFRVTKKTSTAVLTEFISKHEGCVAILQTVRDQHLCLVVNTNDDVSIGRAWLVAWRVFVCWTASLTLTLSTDCEHTLTVNGLTLN